MSEKMFVLEVPRRIAFKSQAEAAGALAAICGSMVGTIEQKWVDHKQVLVFHPWGSKEYEGAQLSALQVVSLAEFEESQATKETES